MEKKEMRKWVRQQKQAYTTAEKKQMSVEVIRQLEKDEHFMRARVVVCYWSLEDEVDTRDFIRKWAVEKLFLLPCVCGEELELRPFEGEEKLKEGESFGIMEPRGICFTSYERIDLVIVPGMAFDREGNRLGRGKGYYDRFLKGCPAYKIGICFPFQFYEWVPVDPYDVPMNTVIK